MQFWVYILRCSDGTYYTGDTDDLEKRMWEHGQGRGSTWTRTRRPVELVWCEDAPTRYEALAFERRVKNWSRAKKEGLIAGDWAAIGYFARPPHERPSTSLRTNEVGELRHGDSVEAKPDSFVPSVVEGRTPTARARPPARAPHERPSTSLRTHEAGELRQGDSVEADRDSFVPSIVEGRATDANAGEK
jgi:predicted GIY-YIG superfamily endonuclease